MRRFDAAVGPRLKIEGGATVLNNMKWILSKSKMRVTEKFHRLKDIQKFLLQYKGKS